MSFQQLVWLIRCEGAQISDQPKTRRGTGSFSKCLHNLTQWKRLFKQTFRDYRSIIKHSAERTIHPKAVMSAYIQILDLSKADMCKSVTVGVYHWHENIREKNVVSGAICSLREQRPWDFKSYVYRCAHLIQCVSDKEVDNLWYNTVQQPHSIISQSGQTQYYSLHWFWLITSAYSPHMHTQREAQKQMQPDSHA